jgi:predicted Zn-dependent protease
MLFRLIRPWSWSRYGWGAFVALVLVGALGGPYCWARYERAAAERALDRYHNDKARAHLANCLWLWPNDPQALLLAARAARRAGEFAEAEEHLRACERLLPQERSVLLEWSLWRAATGSFQTEVEEFLMQQAGREPALAPLIWEALIQGYLRVYRAKDAYDLAERWLKREPDNIQALYLRAEVFQKIRQLPKAVPDYRRVVELDPERDDARKWLARGLIIAGHYGEATTHLDRLRRHSPDDAELVVLQARAFKGLSQLPQARALLDELLAKQPAHAGALRARGELELAEHPAEAETWLRKAAQLMPLDYQTQFLLMQSLNQQGRMADAKALHATVEDLKDRDARLGELINGKLATHPRDPAVHVEMGKLLLSLGHSAPGLAWLQSALQIDPAFRPAHAALAEYYRDTDQQRAAFHRQQAEP